MMHTIVLMMNENIHLEVLMCLVADISLFFKMFLEQLSLK